MFKKVALSLLAIIGLVATPFLPAAEVFASGGANFGATVSLEVTAPMTAAEYETALSTYKRDVDVAVAHQQSWIRVGIPAWAAAWWNTDHLEAGTTDDSLEIETITYYERALDYARQFDLKIYLILTEGIGQDSSYTHAEYVEHMQDYWNFMASHLADKVDVVQIYNEAQSYHYRYYQNVLEEDRADYWSEMHAMLSLAGSIFKTANPDILMTTNSAGFPANEAIEQEYFKFFDAVGGALDIIALDLYPEYQQNIDELPLRISNARERYDKPVMVAEIGRHGMINPQGDETRSIEGQRENLVKYMNALRPTDSMAVFLYALRDDGPDDTDWESNFGILEYTGEPKASFDDVMYAMRPTAASTDTDTSAEADNESGDTTTSTPASETTPGAPNTGTKALQSDHGLYNIFALLGGITLLVVLVRISSKETNA